MNLLGLPPFYQYVTKGSILLTALVLDKLNNDRKKRLGGLRSRTKKTKA
jgi:ABC-type xylose transport system permease subunit